MFRTSATSTVWLEMNLQIQSSGNWRAKYLAPRFSASIMKRPLMQHKRKETTLPIKTETTLCIKRLWRGHTFTHR